MYLESDMRKLSFKMDLAKILQALGFKGWTAPTISIEKVSGSLTNAVFFVHNNVNASVNAGQSTLLLRIYGPSTSSLISRRHELHMLHVLSTRYGIGPRVYGTFVNGRVEQYFDSAPLTPGEMREPTVSRWIGRRMRELHGADVRGLLLPEDMDGGSLPEEGVRRNVRKWIGPAKRVANALQDRDERIREIDLERFEREWEEYWTWLMNWEKRHGKSERVFAHNDTQYGNLLKLRNAGTMEDHKRIIVVDFEYASYNGAAFDIGNHFQEWMANYHSTTPHVMREELYPNKAERYNFYRGYGIEGEKGLEEMDAQVKAWSRASEGMWAVWGIVQAHSDGSDGDSDDDGSIEIGTRREREGENCKDAGESDSGFDYIGYALSRMSRFRRLQNDSA